MVFYTDVVDLSEAGGSLDAFELLFIRPNLNFSNVSLPTASLIDCLVLDIVVVVDYCTNFFGFF